MDFSKAFDRVKHNLLIEKLTQSPLNPYIVNWYVSFLSDRKQRVVCHNTVCDWKDVNRGTTQGSVSDPYLFNLFLNDLAVAQYCQDSDLTKYADDTFIFVTVRKNSVDESQKALNALLEWTEVNCMSCNTSKCKELCMAKKGVTPNFPPLCGIEQSDSFTLLGVTLQNDCKFSSHVKGKLREANKCLYILRSQRKDEYTHLFKAIVLPKITYALPGNGDSQVDLNTMQCFLKRCNKRRYTSELINIYDLLEKCDRRLFTKIKNSVNHPLNALFPQVKESSKKLRSQTSLLARINTERFKNSYFNRIRFL